MQQFEMARDLQKYLAGFNGLYHIDKFLDDTIELEGVTYKLEAFGHAKSNVTNEHSNVVIYSSTKDKLYIYYRTPIDNGIAWDKTPFRLNTIYIM